jgi:predicted nucleotidyltransferase component of viral defense system
VHAVARDLYDLWQLILRGVDEEAVLAALPAKAAHRGVVLGGCLEHLTHRRPALLASWQQTLDYLAPAMEGDAFDRAFTEATRLLARVG